MIKESILLFQKFVPSYRVPIFRELYKNIGVIVCHSKERKGSSLKSFVDQMDYPNELIPVWYYRSSDTAAVQRVLPVLIKYKPPIVVSEFSLGYLTFWKLLFYKPIFRYRLIIWTHGVRNDEIFNPFTRPSRKFFLWLIKKSDTTIFYSQRRRDIIEKRIGNGEKLFVAPNTLDTDKFKLIYSQLKKIGKQNIKDELGFKNKYNIIFTGRLLKEKRIDMALQSFVEVEKKSDVAIHFIGDGPEKYLIKEYQQRSANIIYHGSIYDDYIVGKYLFASDLYLMPGYIGLGIIHAFAFGLPVISCRETPTGPFHSPEGEYLSDKINGLWTNRTILSLSETIMMCLLDNSMLYKLSENARYTSEAIYSIEKMITGFKDAIDYNLQYKKVTDKD